MTLILGMFFGDIIEPLTARTSSSQKEDYLYIVPQVVVSKRHNGTEYAGCSLNGFRPPSAGFNP